MRNVSRMLVTYLRRFFVVIWIVLTGVLAIEVILNNQVAVDGLILGEQQELIKKLELENQVLRNEIAARQSLRYVESRALDLGYEKIKRIEYINKYPLETQ